MSNIRFITTLFLFSAFMSVQAKYTTPIFYQPFSHTPLKQDLIINKTVNGKCYKQSLNDPRKDAWHCLANNQTYDPCFKYPFNNNHELICPYSPWHNLAVKIITEQTLSNKQHLELDMSKNKPWAIELVDGTRCLIISQSVKTSFQYQCENKKHLMGKIYRCKGIWQIYQNDGENFNVTNIKRAWF